MFDLTPQYAPDLEWMLQSGQVPRELLLEALLQEYYAPLYHLALSILDEHAAAQAAASQTFARALLDQHRYRSQDGVEFWLFRIALEVCQPFQKRLKFRRSVKAALPSLARPDDFGDSCPETPQDAQLWLALDNLEENARQLALLRFANGWQPDRIAALFQVADSAVDAVLAAVRQLVAEPCSPDGPPPSADPLPPEQLDPCLIQSLQRRWPAREFAPAELEALAATILRRLRWLGFRQTKALAAVEIGLMALIILLAFATIWGANLLYGPGPDPTPTSPLPTYLVTRVVVQLVTPTPSPPPVLDPTTTPIQLARSNYTEVRPGETLQDVADRLDVTVEDLRYWNRLPEYVEIQAGERLINPQYARSLQPSAATPVSAAEPLPTLANSLSTTRQLIDLLNQREKTIKSSWFDASIIDYGPHSYIGPPRLSHVQIWFSQNQTLAQIGAYGALPDEVIMMPAEAAGQFLARPASDTPWFSEWRTLGDYTSPAMQSISQLGEALFNLSNFDQLSTPRVVGREELAGRSVLKIDLFDPTRNHYASLWVDDSLGQIMRRINYRAGDAPAMEYQINTLETNVDFPQQLFDLRLPWRGWFAQDPRGTPIGPDAPPPEVAPARPTLTVKSPPAGFDPAHSPLTFEYAGSYAGFSPEAQYQVFAGQYFIGQTFFGDPWSMICDRSPDGNWIAYVSQPAQSHDQGSMLHWFDLSEPATRFFTMHDLTGVTELAFSPETRRLAFFSHPNPLTPGTLSTVSLPDQNVRTIYTTGDIKSLVWSPDGKSLAFIERADPSGYQESVKVISSVDGAVSYTSPLDVLSGGIRDWPMVAWGVDFPVNSRAMDDCSVPAEP